MDEIIKQFIQAYYSCIMNDRQNGHMMYAPDAFMSYCGDNIQGQQKIQEKISSFSFKTINVRGF